MHFAWRSSLSTCVTITKRIGGIVPAFPRFKFFPVAGVLFLTRAINPERQANAICNFSEINSDSVNPLGSKQVNDKASTKIIPAPAPEHNDKELGYQRDLQRAISESSHATVRKMRGPSLLEYSLLLTTTMYTVQRKILHSKIIN